ncbi:sodium-dependent transporter [Mobiluncus curtisii]|uniref:sodium-dependent transporter n=1 Tax=Mobiluncus curtisii TaxID=2051 RepID=UPI00179299BF|nr:sodium-dependent transporter [Mobiluncus curtisii]MCU9999974.1 sodium-dependent transporter [Mobiluncus curtisii]MCV0020378.1 sodium-dependent transporter [Mobiluncus curtisii]NMW47087.1 sodium-dependent transporter [Mobiluncus curtisii]NMW49044.1 sodium-dependent transporter [Mobiluncus curtisii]
MAVPTAKSKRQRKIILVDVSVVPEQRASWSGKLGFVLAAAGSAVGLGTIWRFPYLAAHYGGGTFIFVFFLFMLTLGVALLVLEIALGRNTGKSIIMAFASFGKQYRFVGMLTAAVPFIIASYYGVVGGWVTRYMFAYAAGMTKELADGGDNFGAFISDGPQSVAFMLLFGAITFIIVALGVNGGVERANLIMMPALILVSLLIGIFTLTQPGALDGLRYFLVPDFSKFSLELLIAALGQTFFGLSLGAATMVTYGSYMKKDVSVTSSALQTTGTTLGISLLAGLMIIPATFATLGSANAVAKNSGPSLMFLVIPEVFEKFGRIATGIGFVFFLLVMFAALTSMISLVEACVSILQDTLAWKRRQALLVTVVVLSSAGIIVTLGYSSLSFIQPLGEGSTILDFLDFMTSSVMMPLGGLLMCLFFGWRKKPEVLIDEVRLSGEFKRAGLWGVMIKYVAPILLVAIFITSVLKTFGIISF